MAAKSYPVTAKGVPAAPSTPRLTATGWNLTATGPGRCVRTVGKSWGTAVKVLPGRPPPLPRNKFPLPTSPPVALRGGIIAPPPQAEVPKVSIGAPRRIFSAFKF